MDDIYNMEDDLYLIPEYAEWKKEYNRCKNKAKQKEEGLQIIANQPGKNQYTAPCSAFETPVKSWEYIRQHQLVYIRNNWPVYPVNELSGGYFSDCKPSSHPGITEEKLNVPITKKLRLYRCIIPSGYIVIDLDEKNGKHGIAELKKLLEDRDIDLPEFKDVRNGSHPATVRTASGGLHLYFRLPDGEEDILSAIDVLKGVDILCEGHALVTAGSFKNGNFYCANFSDFSKIPELPWDLWIWLQSKKIKEQRKNEFYAEKKASNPNFSDETKNPDLIIKWNYEKFQKGKYAGYNEMLYKSVFELKQKGWEQAQVYEAALDSHAFKDWEDKNKKQQLNAIIKSVYGGSRRRY